jgi:ABC-type transport system involved in multi-copper enzyme maturation permease subunit
LKAIIRYTLITALRDLLFIGLLVITIGAMFIAHFLGGTALSEQQQMILTYVAGSTRLILITGLVLFVCFHVKRAFDNKEIEVILSKPISRQKFIASYLLSFGILAIIVTIPTVMAIAAIAKPNIKGLLFWGGSLIFEGIMMVAFAMVSSLIMESGVAACLATLSFYCLSRMMGFFIMAIHHPKLLPSSGQAFNWLMDSILMLVSVVLPRLDLFGKTSWLVYGIEKSTDLWVFSIQSLVYVPLLLFMAIIDFKRKQF